LRKRKGSSYRGRRYAGFLGLTGSYLLDGGVPPSIEAEEREERLMG